MSDSYEPFGDTPDASPPSEQTPQSPQNQAPTGATPGEGGSADGQSQANVPSFRLREETERRQAVEQAYAQAMQHIATLQAQIQQRQAQQPQVSQARQPGFNVPPAERERIRQQFGAVFPELQTLAEKAEAIQKLLDAMPNVQAQQDYYWQSVGGQFLRSLQEQATNIYGKDLSPMARRQFELGFIDWVENDPQARQRYLAQDTTLVADFWTQYRSHVLDPVRRAAAANLADQSQRLRRIPQPGTATPPPGQRPAKPKTEEELHDAAFAALQSQGG